MEIKLNRFPVSLSHPLRIEIHYLVLLSLFRFTGSCFWKKKKQNKTKQKKQNVD